MSPGTVSTESLASLVAFLSTHEDSDQWHREFSYACSLYVERMAAEIMAYRDVQGTDASHPAYWLGMDACAAGFKRMSVEDFAKWKEQQS